MSRLPHENRMAVRLERDEVDRINVHPDDLALIQSFADLGWGVIVLAEKRDDPRGAE